MFTNQPRSGSPEVQGNTKVLLCYANGLPTPVYRWKKDGRYMTSSNVTDTSLKIQNIQRSDSGEYQCVASNAHGAILSNRVKVHVACKSSVLEECERKYFMWEIVVLYMFLFEI